MTFEYDERANILLSMEQRRVRSVSPHDHNLPMRSTALGVWPSSWSGWCVWPTR